MGGKPFQMGTSNQHGPTSNSFEVVLVSRRLLHVCMYEVSRGPDTHMYISIHTPIYISIYIYIYTYTYTHIYIHIDIHIHTQIYMCIYIYTYSCRSSSARDPGGTAEERCGARLRMQSSRERTSTAWRRWNSGMRAWCPRTLGWTFEVGLGFRV